MWADNLQVPKECLKLNGSVTSMLQLLNEWISGERKRLWANMQGGI